MLPSPLRAVHADGVHLGVFSPLLADRVALLPERLIPLAARVAPEAPVSASQARRPHTMIRARCLPSYTRQTSCFIQAAFSSAPALILTTTSANHAGVLIG